MSREAKCEESELQDFTDSEAEQDDTVTEFRSCSYNCHKKACPKYPKNRVPIKFFEGNKISGSGGLFSGCEFCRNFSRLEAKKPKVRKTGTEKTITGEPDAKEVGKSGEVRKCPNTSHNGLAKSPYPQKSTPIELFMGNKNSPDGMFKTCKDCRNYAKKTNAKIRAKKCIKEEQVCPECKENDHVTGRKANIDRCPICIEKLLKEDEENGNKDFKECSYRGHEASGCTSSKLRVPIFLFRSIPDNPNSFLYKRCKYCRDYDMKCKRAIITKKSSSEIYQNLDVSAFKILIIRITVKYLVYYPELIPNKNLENILLELLYQFNLTKEFPEVKTNIYFLRKEDVLISLSGLTQQCGFIQHDKTTSPFNIGKVPIEFFRKDTEDIFSHTYVYCLDCREYINPGVGLYWKKKREQIKNSRTDPGAEFLSCLLNPRIHAKCSEYPPNKVPINFFRSEGDNIHSNLHPNCKDCRCYLADKGNKLIQKRKEEAIANGKFFCISCNLIKELNERGVNLDGSFSTSCIPCKENSFIRSKELQKKYKEIKFNFMIEINSCCENCNRIFLVINSKIIRLETEVVENKRIVIYNELVYEASEFILKYRDFIELSFMDLDHLSEQEQRERGLLKEDEKFVPKKERISAMSSFRAMELEAHKCQLLCCECHSIITEKRKIEKRGSEENTLKSTYEKEKEKYVNNLKADGCSSCGYVGYYHFMDMDHINPSEKKACISQMVHNSSYTLNQVKEECKKTRVLCRFCHRLHTRKQREEGIIFKGRRNGKKEESSTLPELGNEDEKEPYITDSEDEVENKQEKELSHFDDEEEVEDFLLENGELEELFPDAGETKENFLLENGELEEELFLDIEETKEELPLLEEYKSPVEDEPQREVIKRGTPKIKYIKLSQKPQQIKIKFVRRHR